MHMTNISTNIKKKYIKKLKNGENEIFYRSELSELSPFNVFSCPVALLRDENKYFK